MPALRAFRLFVPAAVVALAACDAGHRGTPASSALAPEPIGLVPVVARPLDEPVLVLFDAALDPSSCTRDTVQITGIDGPGAGTTPNGTLRVTALGDGSFANAVVRFTPSLRVLAGEGAAPDGFFPDTTYSVRLPAGGLRSARGVALANEAQFMFRTRAGASNAALYGNGRPGAPALANGDFAPRVDGDRLAIGTVIDTPSVVKLRFDQPIDTTLLALPYDSTANAPGFASLVYDDPVVGFHRVIPSRVELVANDADGGELALRPEGLLPNAATVRVVLRGKLRDPSGESRDYVDSAAFVVRTEEALRPRGDFAKADFTAATSNDFVEPMAVVEEGVLRAADAFPRDVEGGIVGDWSPTMPVTDFDTDEQEIVYEDGRRRTFVGGVFRVRNLRIPQNHVVRGRGSNPLVFVVEGDAIVDGEISVCGGSAARISTNGVRAPGDVTGNGGGGPNTAQTFGIAHCGGGDGGDGGLRDGVSLNASGLPGRGTGGGPDGGGPGVIASPGFCQHSSAGGGGSFTTSGDPGFWYARPPGFGQFVQRDGLGGYGCSGGGVARTLPGGAASPRPFVDARVDNDFWGYLYDPRRGMRIEGELASLHGGPGGGSGADTFGAYTAQGGGGGAGGGALMIQVRGRLTLGPRSLVDANGGDGACTMFGGGGGGGAGGMVVLMAGERIVLHAHGETYSQARDTNFCIRADGGVSVDAQPADITSKYSIPSAESYDNRPRGGFGGLGLIQLMAPMGTDNDDGTNTVLDDSIDVIQNGIALQGTQKMRYLAWRGLGSDDGTFVDDYGNPTGYAWGEGDMRPSPVLMPVPYGPRSRARSEWVSLGAADRRAMTQHDGSARAVVVESGLAVGPDFAHATREDGWLAYEVVGDRAAMQGAFVDGIVARVVALDAEATWNGRPVLAVQLDAPVFGTAIGRFAGYEAELQDDRGAALHRLRVLSHDGTRTWLESPDEVAGGIARLRLRHGLARTRLDTVPTRRGFDGRLHPLANARIGLAFHRDPANARRMGFDPDRLPATVGTFFHDLGDPNVQQQIRSFGARAVQWDVLFDRQWRPSPFDARPPLDPSLDLALDGLWLPFRF